LQWSWSFAVCEARVLERVKLVQWSWSFAVCEAREMEWVICSMFGLLRAKELVLCAFGVVGGFAKELVLCAFEGVS